MTKPNLTSQEPIKPPYITIVFKSRNSLRVGAKTLKRDVKEFYSAIQGLIDGLSDGAELTTHWIKQQNLIFKLEEVDFILLTDGTNYE